MITAQVLTGKEVRHRPRLQDAHEEWRGEARGDRDAMPQVDRSLPNWRENGRNGRGLKWGQRGEALLSSSNLSWKTF